MAPAGTATQAPRWSLARYQRPSLHRTQQPLQAQRLTDRLRNRRRDLAVRDRADRHDRDVENRRIELLLGAELPSVPSMRRVSSRAGRRPYARVHRRHREIFASTLLGAIHAADQDALIIVRTARGLVRETPFWAQHHGYALAAVTLGLQGVTPRRVAPGGGASIHLLAERTEAPPTLRADSIVEHRAPPRTVRARVGFDDSARVERSHRIRAPTCPAEEPKQLAREPWSLAQAVPTRPSNRGGRPKKQHASAQRPRRTECLGVEIRFSRRAFRAPLLGPACPIESTDVARGLGPPVTWRSGGGGGQCPTASRQDP
jgi:hypothetical protein